MILTSLKQILMGNKYVERATNGLPQAASRQQPFSTKTRSKREKIYKYLSGNISNRSFRKWLLNLSNDDNFFSELDFTELKALSIIFSNPDKIKSILQGYIDKLIVEKLRLAKEFSELSANDGDILVKLSTLSDLGKRLEDKKIISFVKPYEYLFQNAPRLIEKENWNQEIFKEKREIVDKHRKKIIKEIIKFNNKYHFEYEEK
jgi:hypothetical protein